MQNKFILYNKMDRSVMMGGKVCYNVYKRAAMKLSC